MRKRIITVLLICSVVMNSEAQVYSGDTWAQLPTRDLYDSDMMNMYARAWAETAARRQELFYRYAELAANALKNREWNKAIYYVNEAFDTQYTAGVLYYIRGYAYEQLGNYRAAKRDYKKGKKDNCIEASEALEDLKARRKRR